MKHQAPEREPQRLPSSQQPRALRVRVRGVVQGVGFRPMVWRVATEEGLRGYVTNDGSGVLIRVSGEPASMARLVERIQEEAPPLARIEVVETGEDREPTDARDFTIKASDTGENRTRVTADASICAACLAEVTDPSERRYRYPFANCTHCGPRFSIVEEVPYDRCRTTMSAFPMCARCREEYEDPSDRRFHAQPIACADCGPRVWLETMDGDGIDQAELDGADVLSKAAGLLERGSILAIRGLGGFHLACDATNVEAVERLRSRKRRFGKPFALMARDLEVIRRYCSISAQEEALLTSAPTPIVLLQADGPEALPDALAPGLNSLGFVLPYTPLHVLLMEGMERPLVMTSGNLSNEPQVTIAAEARKRLGGVADVVLMHDRDIANRIDDSVARVVGGEARMIRVARGYAPSTLPLPPGFTGAPDLVAYGGELKSTFCLLKDGVAVVSQHQGDLEDVATFDDFRHNMRLYRDMYDHRPSLLVADKHPEYVSGKLARETAAAEGLPLEEVQHHHAHVASCMAENGLPMGTPAVLGVALDGLGFGDDGGIWGGEFLLANYLESRRLASLCAVPMIGGAQAILQPWRSAYAHLSRSLGWACVVERYPDLELCRTLEKKPLAMLDQMVEREMNAPPASSCGRLFDAVAAAVGICMDQVTFEGQGAMELEAEAEAWLARCDTPVAPYPFAISARTSTEPARVDASPMWRALLDDLDDGRSVGLIGARFHLGLADAICNMVRTLHEDPGVRASTGTVALTGGCYQNKLLFESVSKRLESEGYHCLSHSRVPANDGGLALGQAAIAAARALRPDVSRELEPQPTTQR